METKNGDINMEDFNFKVITKTKELLGNTEGIRLALEAGWVGEYEKTFINNLEKNILSVQQSLDKLKDTLDSQIDNNKEQMEPIVPLN